MTEQKENELKDVLLKISNKVISKKQTGYRYEISQMEVDSIFKYYNKIKSDVKQHISSEDFKQDRHKIASTFIFAIMSVNMIKVVKAPLDIKIDEAQKWVNYELAIFFAGCIIFSFNNIKKTQFIYPETLTGKKKYSDYLIALIHSMNDNITHKDTTKLSNYVNSLSHILFLLEYLTIKNNTQE